MSIFIQIYAVASKRRIFSAPECVLAVQGRSGSSQVYDLGANRKSVYTFLLVRYCDIWSYLAPFLRYCDLLAKNCLFLLHFTTPLIRRSRSEINRGETKVMGLSYSEDRMIVAGVVLA